MSCGILRKRAKPKNNSSSSNNIRRLPRKLEEILQYEEPDVEVLLDEQIRVYEYPQLQNYPCFIVYIYIYGRVRLY